MRKIYMLLDFRNAKTSFLFWQGIRKYARQNNTLIMLSWLFSERWHTFKNLFCMY